MRYFLGVLAGIVSGLVFAASSIAQKKAMNAIGQDMPVVKSLFRSPLWLAGFSASFLIGAPLNMAAFVALGPTLPPALGSIGVAAIPIMARLFLGERIVRRSYLGTSLIAGGIILMALSGISLTAESIDWLDRDFLFRAFLSIGLVALAAAAFWLAGFKSIRMPHFLAISAGLALAIANAFMGPISGQIGRFLSKKLDLTGLAIVASASLILIAVNAVAIVLAQIALKRGTAALVVPLQQIPIQITPLFFHVVLYREALESPSAVLLVSLGASFLVFGAFVFASIRDDPLPLANNFSQES